jgi:hypothetical protein
MVASPFAIITFDLCAWTFHEEEILDAPLLEAGLVAVWAVGDTMGCDRVEQVVI